jgi:hypothetical protein
MANLDYVVKNAYTTAADVIQKNSRKKTLIWGGLLSAIALFIAPPIGLVLVLVVLIIWMNAGKGKTQTLKSGAAGEDHIISILNQLSNSYYIFNQVIVPNKKAIKGYNEIDIIVFSGKNIFIIEVKNRKGQIQGSFDDDHWTVHKVGMKGTHYTDTMYNPLKQVKNQQRALENHLKANNLFAQIVPIVTFAGKEFTSNFSVGSSLAYLINSQHLVGFITKFDTDNYALVRGPIFEELKSLKRNTCTP